MKRISGKLGENFEKIIFREHFQNVKKFRKISEETSYKFWRNFRKMIGKFIELGKKLRKFAAKSGKILKIVRNV